jgi:hypothetical protein
MNVERRNLNAERRSARCDGALALMRSAFTFQVSAFGVRS